MRSWDSFGVTFTTFQGDDQRQVRDFNDFGGTYLFGLNYKMWLEKDLNLNPLPI